MLMSIVGLYWLDRSGKAPAEKEEQQEDIIKQHNRMVDYYRGYRKKYLTLGCSIKTRLNEEDDS